MVFRDESGKAIFTSTTPKRAGDPSLPTPISTPKRTGRKRPSTPVTPSVTIAKGKFDSATGLPPPSEPLVSSRDLRSKSIGLAKDIIKEGQKIELNAFYKLESGKVVTGKELQSMFGATAGSTLKSSLDIQPGSYIEKGGKYYKLSPELTYIIREAKPERAKSLLEAFGTKQFEREFGRSYESLTKEEKKYYGYKFTPFLSEPIEEWKYHPGGERYLREHKEDVVVGYIEGKGGYKDFWKNVGATKLLEGAYKLEPEAYGGRGFASESFIKEYAWDVLSLEPQERKGKYFESLPAPAKWYGSFYHSTISAASFPITLPQAVVKMSAGGKTLFLPDVGKKLEERHPGGPYGLISTGISEGLERASWIPYIGGQESDAWERFTKDPVSGVFATGGEILGMWMGGKSIYKTKVATIRGLGHIRSGVFKYTGRNLPSYAQIMYHRPSRILRRWWVQRGTKSIDDIIGKPYHSTETLTEGGLSFAPGKTPQQRITWTVGKTKETWELPISQESYLLGASGSQRIGLRFVIKKQSLHELPALSTAPYGYAPTRFYRFTASGLDYSSQTHLLPKMFRPSGFAIPIKKVFKAPGQFYDEITAWALKQQKGSWGVVGPKMYMGGPETEINIFGKTILKRFLPTSKKISHRIRGYEFYADVPLGELGYLSGKPLIEKVPIVFTKPAHTGFPVGAKIVLGGETGIDKIKNLIASSYKTKPSIPIFNPSYFISASIKGLISKPSSYSVESIPSYSYQSLYSSLSNYYSKSFPSYSKSSVISTSSISSPSSGSFPSMPSSPSVPSSPSIPSSPSYPYYPSYPSYPSSPIVPSYPYPKYHKLLSTLPSSKSRQLGKKQGFNVYVKDRYIVHGKKKFQEKYVKLSRTALSKEDALALGSILVDRSAAASFYIKPVKQSAQPLDMSIPRWGSQEHKFYKRRSKTLKHDIFTEGTSFRIDTSGEVAEIPARGIRARMEQTQGLRLFNQLKTSSGPMDSISRDYDKMMKKLMGAM